MPVIHMDIEFAIAGKLTLEQNDALDELAEAENTKPEHRSYLDKVEPMTYLRVDSVSIEEITSLRSRIGLILGESLG